MCETIESVDETVVTMKRYGDIERQEDQPELGVQGRNDQIFVANATI